MSYQINIVYGNKAWTMVSKYNFDIVWKFDSILEWKQVKFSKVYMLFKYINRVIFKNQWAWSF